MKYRRFFEKFIFYINHRSDMSLREALSKAHWHAQ